MKRVTNTHEDWLRVAQHVVDRRAALGLRQADLAAAGKISVASVQDVEGGAKTRYRPTTLGGIERGLRWKPGSIKAILAGGEPSPVVAGESDAPPVTQVHHGDRVTRFPEDRWARMSDAQRRALLELAELFGEENPERGVNGE